MGHHLVGGAPCDGQPSDPPRARHDESNVGPVLEAMATERMLSASESEAAAPDTGGLILSGSWFASVALPGRANRSNLSGYRQVV